MNFRKNFEIGGEVISDLKIFVANLMLGQLVRHEFLKKSQHFFQKRVGGVVGSKAVPKFYKKSSIFEKTAFPKRDGGRLWMSRWVLLCNTIF